MRKKQMWKKGCALVLSAAMALALAACGGGSGASSGASTGTAPSGGEAKEEKAAQAESAVQSESVAPADTGAAAVAAGPSAEKDKVTVGVTNIWATLTPFQTTQNQNANFSRQLYDRLAFLTPEGEYVPQAAKSWEVEADGITWNVEVYDNITDSEGNKITADDFVWMIEKSMEVKLKPFFSKVEKVEKTGDYTFQVTMKSNMVGAFELVLMSAYAVSKAAFEASPDEFATTVVSSAPYRVKEFVANSHITFEKRDDYWKTNEDSPYLQNNVKEITYKLITEASQQQIALETSTVDGFENLGAALVADFKANQNFSVVGAPGGLGVQMYFSGYEGSPVAEDVDLRKAICHAIDESGLINGVYEGMAEPQHDPANNRLVGYPQKWDSEEYFKYDLELAKDYLSKSKYNGQELVLVQMAGTQGERQAQMIQGYLGAIGIKCKLNILDGALFAASRFDGSQYDVIMISAGGITLPAFWGNRFDMNAYELGDATSRKDEALTQMLYDTWVKEGFTEENIDKIHNYLRDNCIAYGILNPFWINVYNNSLGVKQIIMNYDNCIDLVGSVY